MQVRKVLPPIHWNIGKLTVLGIGPGEKITYLTLVWADMKKCKFLKDCRNLAQFSMKNSNLHKHKTFLVLKLKKVNVVIFSGPG